MAADLSKIVAAPKNHVVRSYSVRKAMELLGELRAREGIDVLVTYIGFPTVQHPDAGEYPPKGASGKNMPPPKGSPQVTKWLMQRHPAVPALISIGEPCTDAVIHKLCNTDRRFEQSLCILVLKKLQRPASIREKLQLAMPKVLPRRLGALGRALKALNEKPVTGK